MAVKMRIKFKFRLSSVNIDRNEPQSIAFLAKPFLYNVLSRHCNRSKKHEIMIMSRALHLLES